MGSLKGNAMPSKDRVTTLLLTKNITVAAVNAGTVPISIPPTAIESEFMPFVQVGFTFVDANGAVVTPGAGTLTIEGKTIVNPDHAEAIINGTAIDATVTPITLFFTGAASSIEVSGSGITTATNIIIRILPSRG